MEDGLAASSVKHYYAGATMTPKRKDKKMACKKKGKGKGK